MVVSVKNEVMGTTGTDILTGMSGMVNYLSGGGGNDTLIGKDRADVAVYTGNRSDYTVTTVAGVVTVTDNRPGSPDGTDTLQGINILQFADNTLFVTLAANRVSLTGGMQTYVVANSEFVTGTASVEHFIINPKTSAYVSVGSGDTVDLAGNIGDYTYKASGSQLQISDGVNTTVLTVGGSFTLRTATGSTTVTLDFAAGGVIKLGSQVVGGVGFDATTAITNPGNVSSVISGVSNTPPTVTGLTTDDTTPTITGTVEVGEGQTLEVTVNGVTYTTETGVILGAGNTWSLTLAADLAQGTYEVSAALVSAGVSASSAVTGTAGADILTGTAGMVNVYTGGAGNDSIAGKDRADVAVYTGNRSDYTVTTVAGVVTVTDNRPGSPDGTDTLRGINILQFADNLLFLSAVANRVSLAGGSQTFVVGNSELVAGTAAAEHFLISPNTSAYVLVGKGDTVDLSGAIGDYTYKASGTQLQISDGVNTTVLTVGGAFTLRTASGSTTVMLDFAAGGVIKLGTQVVGGVSFNAAAAITNAANISDMAIPNDLVDTTPNELVIDVNDAPAGQLRMLSSAVGSRSLSATDITNPSTQFFWSSAVGGNDHIYEVVMTGVTWTAARDLSAMQSLSGVSGYLVTITSSAEQSFITGIVSFVGDTQYWIGASDEETEGVWKWVTGPEAGTQFWQGLAASSGGYALSGQYSNFYSIEPNISMEDYGLLGAFSQPLWSNVYADFVNFSGAPKYIIEYSGNVSIGLDEADTTAEFTEGQVLYADASLITDPDGLGTLSWQWQRSTDGGTTWTDIPGATGDSYILGNADIGNQVSLKGTYTDSQGFLNTVYSGASAVVVNFEDEATGALSVAGTAEEGGSLTASLTGAFDPDGAIAGTAFQWQISADGASWTNINAATSSTYVLASDQSQVGQFVRVVVTTTDSFGGTTVLTGDSSVAVANVNDAPVGVPQMLAEMDSETLVTTYQLTESDITNLSTQRYNPANGHIYEYIGGQVSWTDANASASARNIAGVQGHLATITNAAENTFIFANAPPAGNLFYWLGASDAEVEGVWRWVTGPEAGTQFANATGASVNGEYSALQISGPPPATEDYAMLDRNWTNWNDIANSDGGLATGYIVEYSGTITTTLVQVPGRVASTVADFTEDATLYASGSGISDDDGLGLFSYQWQRSDGSGGWTSITGATGSSYTLGDADVGMQVRVQVIYTDFYGTQESVASAASAVIANVNDAPTVANAIADQNATEDSAYSFQFASNSFADVDGDNLTYSAQLTGGGALPVWLSFDAATRTFSGTPANGDVGTVNVTVTADDGNGGTVTDSFAIVVANTNDPPTVANSQSVSVIEDTAKTITVTGNDIDGDVLTYLSDSSSDSGNGTITGGAGGVFIYTPNSNFVGSDSFTVTVVDPSGLFVTQTVNVTVTAVEDEATGTLSVTGTAEEGGSLTASLTGATDPDGAITGTAYQWQISTDGSTWTNISGATAATYNLASDQSQVGKFVRVVVTTTDSFGGTTTFTGDSSAAILDINEQPSGQLQLFAQVTTTITRDLNATDITNSSSQFFWSASVGGNNHIYEIINVQYNGRYTSGGITWQSAISAAELSSISGVSGYLVTITSLAEQSFISTRSSFGNLGYWMGASDADAEGIWKWVSGPEAGTQFWSGPRATSGGSPVNGSYTNWASNSPETPGSTSYLQDYAVLQGTVVDSYFGTTQQYKWMSAFPNDSQWGYIIEYSGQVSEQTVSSDLADTSEEYTQGITLQVNSSLVTDEDGLGAISWQWQRSTDSGTTWLDIPSATSNSYVLSADDVGNQVRVKGSYVDGEGFNNTVYSEASLLISAAMSPMSLAIDSSDSAPLISDGTASIKITPNTMPIGDTDDIEINLLSSIMQTDELNTILAIQPYPQDFGSGFDPVFRQPNSFNYFLNGNNLSDLEGFIIQPEQDIHYIDTVI